MYAYEIRGNRHDAGDKLGFLIATVEFALKNPLLDRPLATYLSRPHASRPANIAAPAEPELSQSIIHRAKMHVTIR